MVSEQELKLLVEKMIKQVMAEDKNENDEEDTAASNEDEEVIVDEDEGEFLPDVTEINIRKDLLVPNAANSEGYLKMKETTPARIGVWRAGPRYKTSTSLRFRSDHAAAQDAVFSYVDEELVKKLGLITIETLCRDKDEYLTRPDLGRQFSEETINFMKIKKRNPKVQIVVGDGLSSAAIEANVEDILPAIKQGLKVYDIEVDDIFFVKHCRVPAMDVIGETTGAEVVCLLVGERPGLVTAESMSAYIAYKPTVDMPEARRTVVSNIHNGGTPAVEAGAHIAELLKKMLDKKASGIDLKQ